MLSVLIPVRNWPLKDLVESLSLQLEQSGHPYEILIGDDGSDPEHSASNQQLEAIPGVHFFCHNTALGRSANRNFLARQAHYPMLLFLDGDAAVVHPNFIENYLQMADDHSVICGGTGYTITRPTNPDHLLRWKYGRAREEKTAAVRQIHPWNSFSTFNFLIPSNLFSTIGFDESISGYGHEDTLFGYQLKTSKIPVTHLDNQLLHIGLESASQFLEKSRDSVRNLANLYLMGKIMEEDARRNKLIRSWLVIKHFGARKIVTWLFRLIRKQIEKNLIGKRPSLLLFDLYKLGLICHYG